MLLLTTAFYPKSRLILQTLAINPLKRLRNKLKTNLFQKSKLQNRSQNNKRSNLKSLNMLNTSADVVIEDAALRGLKDGTMTTWM